MAVIKVKDDGSFDHVVIVEVVKSNHSMYILKVETIGFAHRLDMK